MRKKHKQQEDRFLKQLRPVERRQQERIRAQLKAEALSYLYVVAG